MTQTNFNNYKRLLTAAIIVVVFAMLLSIATIFVDAALGLTPQALRGNLWTKGGSVSMSNEDTLTLNALLHYAREGAFGEKCKTYALNNTYATLNDFTSDTTNCKKGAEFYIMAEKYGRTVDARMSIADPTGARLDKAMTRFSLLADEVFAIMIGFGLLTSLLVFIIIFMRISWMPSHAIDRRKVIIDVATAGAATMLLGNIWVVISLFQSCFNRFWQTFAVYSKDWRTVANMVLVEYKGFIVGLSGIATLLVLAMFVVNFIGMALDGGAANKRSEKITKLVQCAIAAAGLGSLTLIVGFFWNLFV
jgi:hypothetical protein